MRDSFLLQPYWHLLDDFLIFLQQPALDSLWFCFSLLSSGLEEDFRLSQVSAGKCVRGRCFTESSGLTRGALFHCSCIQLSQPSRSSCCYGCLQRSKRRWTAQWPAVLSLTFMCYSWNRNFLPMLADSSHTQWNGSACSELLLNKVEPACLLPCVRCFFGSLFLQANSGWCCWRQALFLQGETCSSGLRF